MSDSLNTTTNTAAGSTGAALGGAPGAFDSTRPDHRAPIVDGAVHRLESGREWARTRAERFQDEIRAHPLRTTAYAVGAGVLAGMAMRAVRPRGR